MSVQGSALPSSFGPTGSPRGRSRLAIVEPDRLTRWSLSAYLANAFNVLTAESATEARRLLDKAPVEAIVISDDLPDNGADEVERFARSRNPEVAVVRTITTPAQARAVSPRTLCLEKPFQLSALASLLGVSCDCPNQPGE